VAGVEPARPQQPVEASSPANRLYPSLLGRAPWAQPICHNCRASDVRGRRNPSNEVIQRHAAVAASNHAPRVLHGRLGCRPRRPPSVISPSPPVWEGTVSRSRGLTVHVRARQQRPSCVRPGAEPVKRLREAIAPQPGMHDPGLPFVARAAPRPRPSLSASPTPAAQSPRGPSLALPGSIADRDLPPAWPPWRWGGGAAPPRRCRS